MTFHSLYHYFDESTGPFRNLSDLEPHEAENILNDIRLQDKGFASNFSDAKPYRRQVYTFDEILHVIEEFGMPQQWNANGEKGPERYIEVQIWDDKPLRKWIT